MSLFYKLLILGAGVMLLPVDEKKQAEFSATASRAAAETATFCQRNVDTCATGRELWGLLVQKAEYGVELGARLVRAEIARSRSSEDRATPAAHRSTPQPTEQDRAKWEASQYAPYDPLAPSAATTSAQVRYRGTNSQIENSSRWR